MVAAQVIVILGALDIIHHIQMVYSGSAVIQVELGLSILSMISASEHLEHPEIIKYTGGNRMKNETYKHTKVLFVLTLLICVSFVPILGSVQAERSSEFELIIETT